MGRFYSATVQFNAIKNEVEANVRRIGDICAYAKKLYPDLRLVVFPEMCTTGYIYASREEIFPYTELEQGRSFQALSQVCKNNSLYLAYGFAERDNGVLYNSQNIIRDDGSLLGCYRKKHLYDADVFWSAPGNTGFMTAETPLGKLGFGICMDLNYDDFVDFHIASSTDIVCFATNWLEEHLPIHDYWLMRWNGFEKQVLMANRYGIDVTTEFCGRSCVISDGLIVCSVDPTGESIIVTEHSDKTIDNKG